MLAAVGSNICRLNLLEPLRSDNHGSKKIANSVEFRSSRGLNQRAWEDSTKTLGPESVQAPLGPRKEVIKSKQPPIGGAYWFGRRYDWIMAMKVEANRLRGSEP